MDIKPVDYSKVNDYPRYDENPLTSRQTESNQIRLN